MSVAIHQEKLPLKNINFLNIQEYLYNEETICNKIIRFRNPETNKMNLVGGKAHKRLLKYTTQTHLVPLIELNEMKVELRTTLIPGVNEDNLSYYGKFHPYYNAPIRNRSSL